MINLAIDHPIDRFCKRLIIARISANIRSLEGKKRNFVPLQFFKCLLDLQVKEKEVRDA